VFARTLSPNQIERANMARLVAPDKGVRETEVNGRLYKPDRGGIYNVDSASAARAMKAEGYFEAALNPYTSNDNARGFTCVECGFGSWFRLCSRCGHTNGEPQRDGE
jgi:hypothetical protein